MDARVSAIGSQERRGLGQLLGPTGSALPTHPFTSSPGAVP